MKNKCKAVNPPSSTTSGSSNNNEEEVEPPKRPNRQERVYFEEDRQKFPETKIRKFRVYESQNLEKLEETKRPMNLLLSKEREVGAFKIENVFDFTPNFRSKKISKINSKSKNMERLYRELMNRISIKDT